MTTSRMKVVNLLESLIDDPKKVTNMEKAILNWSISNSKKKNAPKSSFSKINKKHEIDFDDVDYERIKIQRNFEDKYFCNIYNARARKVIYNLRKVPGLNEKINNGELDPIKLPSMTPHEMHPDRWQALFDKKAAKERANLDLENVENLASGLYTCSKCKSDKTVFYSLQTRSADEPMTQYITCLNCGKKWKD